MTQDSKKQHFRNEFKEFVEKASEISLGELDDKQRTQFLTKFYVTEIHNLLKTSVPEDDFDRGYVDASGDLGVDFIHTDDHQVLILQSKYAASKTSVKSGEVTYFHSVLERLFNPAGLKPNVKLADALVDVDFKRDTFTCKFISMGKLDGQALTLSKRDPIIPKVPGLADRVTFEYLGDQQLTDELRSARSQSGVSSTTHELIACDNDSNRSQIIELDEEAGTTAVMVISAAQILNVFAIEREKLFSLNIRNYIGSTITNKAIVKSAQKTPGQFFNLNNGIACVADEVKIDHDKHRIHAKGLQVINGAQTVKSLRKAQERGERTGGEPKILVRVTEIKKGYGTSGRFRNDIIRANNTQNVIKVSDFRSNDPIQTDLFERFKSYKRFGQKILYIPKRMDDRTPNAVRIKLEEFSKTIYSFLGDPFKFAATTSFLFDTTESGGYRIIFGDGQQTWESMPQEEFELRSAVWWMGTEFARRLKDERAKESDSIAKNALERKWWVIYAARLVLEANYGDKFRSILSRHYKGGWVFREKPVGEAFEELYKRARQGVVSTYRQAAKQSDFSHRNWMRNPNSAGDLAEEIKGQSEWAPKLTFPEDDR